MKIWGAGSTLVDNAKGLFPCGFDVKPDSEEAVRWLGEAVRNGVPEADGAIGAVHMDGRARPRDFYLARQRLEIAAKAGDASAQFRLGDACYRGLGALVDPMAAADWYERAAAQGHSRAAVAIGSLLAAGQGRPQDKAAAGVYFEKAAMADDAQGLYRAGLMC